MTKVLPMPTTDATLGHALRRSLIDSGAAKSAGLTWGDFKQAGDALLKDDEPFAFVEYGIKQGGLGFIIRDEDEDPSGVGLREL